MKITTLRLLWPLAALVGAALVAVGIWFVIAWLLAHSD